MYIMLPYIHILYFLCTNGQVQNEIFNRRHQYMHGIIVFLLSLVCSCCRYKTKKVRDLWWLGLPPGVRGEVWKKALGNDLNISPGEVTGKDLKFSFVLNGGWTEREDEISSLILFAV